MVSLYICLHYRIDSVHVYTVRTCSSCIHSIVHFIAVVGISCSAFILLVNSSGMDVRKSLALEVVRGIGFPPRQYCMLLSKLTN